MVMEEMVEEVWLPGRAAAETAISRIMHEGRPAFVLAVVATQVAKINEEYGYREGDRVFAALARRLLSIPVTPRQLFRWSATSFLVVSSSLHKGMKTSSFAGATTEFFSASPEDQPRALFDRIDDHVASTLACYEGA